MVTEKEGHRFLLKIESVGLKLHQNTPEKFCMVWNMYVIMFQ